MGPARLGFTDAKSRLSSVFDDVVQSHTVRVIERQKSAALVLLELDALAELLAKDFLFTTHMTRSETGEVSIWLDQFDVYGRGKDIAAALETSLTRSRTTSRSGRKNSIVLRTMPTASGGCAASRWQPTVTRCGPCSSLCQATCPQPPLLVRSLPHREAPDVERHPPLLRGRQLEPGQQGAPREAR